MFGVSILVKDKWMKKNCPTWKVIDPLSWFPDTKGWLTARNFRFMYFETTAPMYKIKKDENYINTDILEAYGRSSVRIQNDIAYTSPRLLQQEHEEYEGNEDASLLE